MNVTLVLPALLLAAAVQAASPPKDALDPVTPRDIQVTLVPEKASMFLGEPITAELVVKNVSDGPLDIQGTDDFDVDYYMARQNTLQLTAVDDKGVAAPAPAWRRPAERIDIHMHTFGRNLPPGGSTRLRFDIPPLVAFEHPGAYTLTATATFTITGAGRTWARIPMKASATLEVLPADPERMGRLIADLERKSTATTFARVDEGASQPEAGQSEAARRLSFITDERVIPFYRRQMRIAERDGEFTATMDALSKFDDDDALDSLKDGLEITEIVGQFSHKPDPGEAGEVRISAAKSLLYGAHPGAIPLLLAHRDDPDPQVRCIVVEGLGSGKVPQAEALSILQHMAKDKTDFVADRAKNALTNLSAKKAP